MPSVRQIVGHSKPAEQLRHEIALVAGAQCPVLIAGESGSGRVAVAHAIHSVAANSHLLHLPCTALPPEGEALLPPISCETTLLLDSVNELPRLRQAELLRLLKTRKLHPETENTLRIIATCGPELEKEVAAGGFRADLFHRLNVYPLTVPPLRERREDLALLAEQLLREIQPDSALTLTEEALEKLRRHTWPGNLLELKNVLTRAVLKLGQSAQQPLTAEQLTGFSPAAPLAAVERSAPGDRLSLREETRNFQRRLIAQAVEQNHGNWAAAARDLGMNRSNLHNLARRLKLR